MAEAKNWDLICYDTRSPQRWRKAYKLVQTYGERVQYSVFRCWLNPRDREKLRWELENILAAEDDLLLVRLSHNCAETIPTYNRPNSWPANSETYRIV
ncbi:MAG TPA: CRISPR-associated endonuclease Cas2 [Microcoleaceae bacterium UBA11344]|nr:CRISPR-associated endonuclease Cas2 [Microcoleaceae cyanobacterium UBA11344]